MLTAPLRLQAQIFNLDSYIRIVKDKSLLRRIIFASQSLIDRCFMGEDEPDQILANAEETLLKLGEARAKDALSNPRQIIEEFLSRGVSPAIHDGKGKSVSNCATSTWIRNLLSEDAG